MTNRKDKFTDATAHPLQRRAAERGDELQAAIDAGEAEGEVVGDHTEDISYKFDDDEADEETFEIVRFTFNGPSEVIATGLTLDEAQDHCNREDTHGEGWFDGYRAE